MFGNEDVEQMPEYREWLGWHLETDVPPWGICMECAERRNACAQCGRVAVLRDFSDVFLQTQALDGADAVWLRAGRLEALVGMCECCVVREHLMDHDVVRWRLSNEVTFDLVVIMTRHWARSFYLEAGGIPASEPKADTDHTPTAYKKLVVTHFRALNQQTGTSRLLEHIVEFEARKPEYRRALEMLAENYYSDERPMPPRLQEWAQRWKQNKLPKQTVGRPVDGYKNSIIALIIVDINNLQWIRECSDLPLTRNRGTNPKTALSICDATVEGLSQIGCNETYDSVEKIVTRRTKQVLTTEKPSKRIAAIDTILSLPKD